MRTNFAKRNFICLLFVLISVFMLGRFCVADELENDLENDLENNSQDLSEEYLKDLAESEPVDESDVEAVAATNSDDLKTAVVDASSDVITVKAGESLEVFSEEISKSANDRLMITGEVSYKTPISNNEEPNAYFQLYVEADNPSQKDGKAVYERRIWNKYGKIRRLEGNSRGWQSFALPFLYVSKRDKPRRARLVCVASNRDGFVKLRRLRLVDGDDLTRWTKSGIIPQIGWWKLSSLWQMAAYFLLVSIALGLCMSLVLLYSYVTKKASFVNFFFFMCLMGALGLIFLGWYAHHKQQPWWVFVLFLVFGFLILIFNLLSWYWTHNNLVNTDA